jgi:hypothetical protein
VEVEGACGRLRRLWDASVTTGAVLGERLVDAFEEVSAFGR